MSRYTQGITTRLSAYSDMLVVGTCCTGEEARVKIPQVLPDLILPSAMSSSDHSGGVLYS